MGVTGGEPLGFNMSVSDRQTVVAQHTQQYAGAYSTHRAVVRNFTQVQSASG